MLIKRCWNTGPAKDQWVLMRTNRPPNLRCNESGLNVKFAGKRARWRWERCGNVDTILHSRILITTGNVEDFTLSAKRKEFQKEGDSISLKAFSTIKTFYYLTINRTV